jgi:hypothetical protein
MPDKAAESRAYKRGYNLIIGASFFYPRPAADIIARYNAEAPELRDSFMRGAEAGERRRSRELSQQWNDYHQWLKLLNQTERVVARCWAMNVALRLGGLYDTTAPNGDGQVCARSVELKAVVKRLVEGRLLKSEVLESL